MPRLFADKFLMEAAESFELVAVSFSLDDEDVDGPVYPADGFAFGHICMFVCFVSSLIHSIQVKEKQVKPYISTMFTNIPFGSPDSL